MARESGLSAAMLTAGADETPWAVGVAIGGKYYLFDTKLGLPLPGTKPGEIVTLDQLNANPKLLTALDLSLQESLADDTKYWVRPDDLKTLKAKVYVVPESLSQRMQGLESSLVGDGRMSLGAFPTRQLEKLPSVDGVVKGLWDVDFETHRFRDAVRKAIPEATSNDDLNDRLRWYFQEESYVDNFYPYRTARVRFFKGDFEAKEEDLSRNAVESFQFLTYTEDQIDQLGTDKTMMRIAGIDDIKDQTEFKARLRSTQSQMRLIRRDMGYFLSQCLFDNGGPGTSANWLEAIVNEDDVQRWKSGVKYLLGRSYESRKEYDRSIEEYKFEDSQQVHGNLIRVRMLKAAIAQAYPDAKKATVRAADSKQTDKKSAHEQPESEKAEGKKAEQKPEDMKPANAPRSTEVKTKTEEKKTDKDSGNIVDNAPAEDTATIPSDEVPVTGTPSDETPIEQGTGVIINGQPVTESFDVPTE